MGMNICSVWYVEVWPQHKHGFLELGVLNSSEWKVWQYQKHYQLLPLGSRYEFPNILHSRSLYILSVCTFKYENHSLTIAPNCDKSPWQLFDLPHFLCSAWRQRVDVLLPPVRSSRWVNTFQHALQRALGELFWISASWLKYSQTTDLFAFYQTK